MSLLALIVTAGALGLLGGLHCIAMCSAAQRIAIHPVAVRPASRRHPGTEQAVVSTILMRPAAAGAIALPAGGTALAADLAFHASRLLGYALLGALVGGGSSLLRWGAEGLPWMRPLWGSTNAALLALGLALLVLGRQPRWLDAMGQRIWHAARSLAPSGVAQRSVSGDAPGDASGNDRGHDRANVPLDGRGARAGSWAARPAVLGLGWALLPCGLLYSALAVAMLASDPLGGAVAMLAFGLGTTANLMGARFVLDGLASRLADRLPGMERAGVRIGGALIAAMAAAALVALALGQPHPFCIG
jgi:uncharacterized protein